MLPEPDLFSSVNNHKSSSYSQSETSEDTNLVVDASVNYAHPDKTVCESERSYLNSSVGSKDQRDRRVRRWFLTVIVLLYIGLITSFCLNVSLLLKSYPEPSLAEIRLSQHQLGLEEAELSRGKYLSSLL